MIELPAFLDGTATCATTNTPDLWHSTLAVDEARAAAHCRACPLRQACADYALTNGEQRGTWGGLRAKERRRLLNPADQSWLDEHDRVRRPCGSDAAYRAHRRYDETCEVCEAAQAGRVEEQRRRLLETAHAKGGTANGAVLHRRLGEPVCVRCRAAVARQSAAQRKARMARAQQGPALALAS
ncbi:WhiB family transcriptional regulator [Streptomyces sp. BE230]|uniref:WhiB family transcriptional regulator n=1 Tax=Streptomyces sp. BE230 TaxID=3002526 RepID=UPI002ED1B3D2|nr:WhiB family transcriptional regulator [Streptomyces sp. BE230]